MSRIFWFKHLFPVFVLLCNISWLISIALSWCPVIYHVNWQFPVSNYELWPSCTLLIAPLWTYKNTLGILSPPVMGEVIIVSYTNFDGIKGKNIHATWQVLQKYCTYSYQQPWWQPLQSPFHTIIDIRSIIFHRYDMWRHYSHWLISKWITTVQYHYNVSKIDTP